MKITSTPIDEYGTHVLECSICGLLGLQVSLDISDMLDHGRIHEVELSLA